MIEDHYFIFHMSDNAKSPKIATMHLIKFQLRGIKFITGGLVVLVVIKHFVMALIKVLIFIY